MIISNPGLAQLISNHILFGFPSIFTCLNSNNGYPTSHHWIIGTKAFDCHSDICVQTQQREREFTTRNVRPLVTTPRTIDNQHGEHKFWRTNKAVLQFFSSSVHHTAINHLASHPCLKYFTKIIQLNKTFVDRCFTVVSKQIEKTTHPC